MSEPHIHRWLLEPGKEVDCLGVCACGASRVFGGAEAEYRDRILRRYATVVPKLSRLGAVDRVAADWDGAW